MKYKPSPKLLILLGLLALAFAAMRSGSGSRHAAPSHGPGQGFAPGVYGYGSFDGRSFGGSTDAWYGGGFYGNSNLGTAVSSSGGSGYIAVGGGDFVSW